MELKLESYRQASMRNSTVLIVPFMELKLAEARETKVAELQVLIVPFMELKPGRLTFDEVCEES